MKKYVVQVGELALNHSGAFKIGPFGSSLKKTELVASGIPVAGIENVLPNEFVKGFRRFITPRKFDELSDYEILPDDVLVTTMGTIGRAASAPPDLGRAIFDSHLFRMRVDTNRVFPPYLCYALNSDLVASQLAQMARGAIMEGLNTTILRECSVPLPDLPEQRRITGRLEQADRLRRTRRYALKLTDTFLPSAFLELFGDPQLNSHKLPVEFLGDLCERVTVGFVGTMVDEYVPRGIPLLRSLNVRRNVIDRTDLKFVSQAFHQRLSKSSLAVGDVVSVRTGKPGVTAVIPQSFEAANCADLIVMTCGAKLHPSFLSELLNLMLGDRDQFQGTTGAIQTHFNIERAKEVLVPLPPLPLQHKFAAMVERVGRLRAMQREALRQADHLFASLLHRAFST